MNKKIRKLLYRSFDGELTPAEQQRLDRALEHSKELQQEKAQITAMRQLIARSSVQTFQPFFAERIMQQIRSLEKSNHQFFESLFFVFRPVAIAATVVLIVLISYNIVKSRNVSFAVAFAEPQITLEQVLEPTLPLSLE